MKTKAIRLATLLASISLSACNSNTDNISAANASGRDLLSTVLQNQAAYIPPQCYTRTSDADGQNHNPCFTCHQKGKAPNYLNDSDLQLVYSFAEYARENHWSNLFSDRREAIAAIGDEQISQYTQQNNYLDSDGSIKLANRLKQVPAEWDADADGKWSGYVPDAGFNFDEDGFDRDPSGNLSGWRAFGYTPFPGTFWPTNGSGDDVLIRLAAPFRQNQQGEFDRDIYRINLAIVEALILRRDVPISATDERNLGVDLDKSGSLDTATLIRYDWAPLEKRHMYWVGLAGVQHQQNQQPLAAGLFPVGTEFLHSVRYLDTSGDRVGMAPRMKELRYAQKKGWRNYGKLENQVAAESKEKRDFPDRLRTLLGNLETGISNNQGWVYQGFIEDQEGELRPQTYEETVFCMGCHGGIGATTDSVFSFPRKLDSNQPQNGWFHWSQHSLSGVPEPIRSDGEFEYSHYLLSNGAGDEFRENAEVKNRFLNADGSLKAEMSDALHKDVSVLLLPSRSRAIDLNKAYRTIVEAQSFIYGRDALLSPPENVHRSVKDAQPTGVTAMIKGPNETP